MSNEEKREKAERAMQSVVAAMESAGASQPTATYSIVDTDPGPGGPFIELVICGRVPIPED